MKYIAAFVIILVSVYMIVNADMDPKILEPAPCGDVSLTYTGADIRITEIGFDGNDEWIEISNIGTQDFSGILTLSGVKSTTLHYSLAVATGTSIIIGDSLSALTGYVYFLTGQGFSIPDTTGFTITLFSGLDILQQQSFSKQYISAVPNEYSLEAIRSGETLFWQQTVSSSIVTGFTNPGILFCQPTLLPYEEVIPDPVEPILTGNAEDDAPAEDLQDTPPSQDETSPDPELPDPAPVIFVPQDLPCTISEIHSVTDTYPEYVEFYCPMPFSGTLSTVGIGVGDAVKHINIHSNGGYRIVASTYSGFFTTGNMTLISSISLRDSGEEIQIFGSGFITGGIIFPETNKSYYPACSWSGCEQFPSPGFSEKYLAGIVQTITPPAPLVTNQASTSNNSTYYQDLYQKRKANAERYKKENTSLKSENTKLQKSLSKMSTGSGKTTSKATAKSASKPAPKKKAVSSSAKTDTTPKQTKSTKPTIPKTTSKPGTISKTSKAYIKLVDEHKLYKSYIDFVDGYLKNHLYTQYSSLGLKKLQEAFKKSLQAAGKQQYILSGDAHGTSISIFDFAHLLPSESKSLDRIYKGLFNIYRSMLKDFAISGKMSYKR